MSKLKPCPFCGGEAEYDNSDVSPSSWIVCKNCGARSASTRNSDAGRFWNARVCDSEQVISFADIPLGGRFRYPDSDRVWVVIEKHRVGSNTEPMSGIVAEYTPTSAKLQSICSHIGGHEDCPDEVIYLGGKRNENA